MAFFSSRGYIEQIRRKIHIVRVLKILLVFLSLAALVLSAVFLPPLLRSDNARAQELWQNAEYEALYELSTKNLEKQPLSPFWLNLQGFSAYQVASAQINTSEIAEYIDISIYALRKALLQKKVENKARIHYVLGKAYFLKDAYYADSAIEHLNMALELGYEPIDLHEYLGLAYANIKDYEASIIAFTKALGDYPSDLLLLAIAKSYAELGNIEQSSAYLITCIEQTKDVGVRIEARLDLGANYLKEGDWEKARQNFEAVLSDDDQNAQAHFYMGELWLGLDDSVKARAEWRKALRTDPAHLLARSRLSL